MGYGVMKGPLGLCFLFGLGWWVVVGWRGMGQTVVIILSFLLTWFDFFLGCWGGGGLWWG